MINVKICPDNMDLRYNEESLIATRNSNMAQQHQSKNELSWLHLPIGNHGNTSAEHTTLVRVNSFQQTNYYTSRNNFTKIIKNLYGII